MNRILSLFVPALLFVAVISVSSCTTKTAKVLITVLHDTIQLNISDSTYDTIEGPLQGATVRLYYDQNGGEISETVETNSQGQAEFEFDNIAILDLDITFFTQQVTKPSAVILEEGETVEVTVNIDNP